MQIATAKNKNASFLSTKGNESELQNNETTIYTHVMCKRRKRNSRHGIEEITNTKTNICINSENKTCGNIIRNRKVKDASIEKMRIQKHGLSQ